MSLCAGYRPGSPIKRSVPLFRPLCTTEKPTQLNWFSSALKSLNETSDYSQRRIVTNLPPPPLPPRGGTEQQQLQRKSLTSRWLESKESSSSTSSVETDDGSIDRKENIDEKELQKPLSAFGYPKPYGDNEIIEEQTRRSLETMSVVAEETEEDMEEEGAVKFIGQRPINEVWKSDDSGVVHRSDFLKSSTAYDSSESDEDDSPHAHLAAMYGIHRIGFYEPVSLIFIRG
uniref:Chlororespiratory reduction 7 n=2 Tax=Panagrolaimus sp. JU765 TaxID=591449 RepID=A0AC34Q024_9BILA